MVIRRCTAAEVDETVAVINDAAEAYRGIIPADRWHDPYMPLDALWAEIDAGVTFWAAVEGDRIEAVMGLQAVQDVALIRQAYTRTASQGRGFGRALLAHLRALTPRPILIGTWATATWAVRFYERHGFRLVAPDEKAPLLRRYWTVPERQIEESVVLADDRWFARTADAAATDDDSGLRRVAEGGITCLEGPADGPLLDAADDAARVIEACFARHERNVLLHAPNMPGGFFDLSSGQAGAILQRFRNYGVRLVVVCPPGSVDFSRRFSELLAEERRSQHFAVVETREAALRWLGGGQARMRSE